MARRTFAELWELAVARKGEDALLERLPAVEDPSVVAAHGDDRWLAVLTQHVFSAGFTWRVIAAKWDGFEEAFEGFDPATVAKFDDDRVAMLVQDTRIVRNNQKITATVANARFVKSIAEEHASFGQWIADWPTDDIVELWQALEKGGSRLGGATGPRSLRAMGKDTFILTPDVVSSLTEQGVLTGPPSGKAQKKRAQEAFNAWTRESGRPMAHISLVIACTVDRPRTD